MAIDSQDRDLEGAGELTLDGLCRLEIGVHGGREGSDSQHHLANLRAEARAEVSLDQSSKESW